MYVESKHRNQTQAISRDASERLKIKSGDWDVTYKDLIKYLKTLDKRLEKKKQTHWGPLLSENSRQNKIRQWKSFHHHLILAHFKWKNNQKTQTRWPPFFIWLHSQHFIYLTEAVQSQTSTVAKEGNLLKKMIHGFQAKQLMSQQCTVGIFGGVSMSSCING